jgi:hypothetical protein
MISTSTPKAGLAKRVAGALDLPAAGLGLGLGLVAVLVSVVVFDVAPVGIAIGLLALLAID